MATVNEYKNLPEELIKLIEIAQHISEADGSHFNIEIIEHNGGGSTEYVGDDIIVKIPTTTTGPGIIPINNAIKGYDKATFLQYDQYAALIHELSHAVLKGIGNTGAEEINIAILAVAYDTVKNKLKKYESNTNYKLLFGYGIQKLLSGHIEYGFNVEDTQQVFFTNALSIIPVWKNQQKFDYANKEKASFENRYLYDNISKFGLSTNSKLYRTGYASHLDVSKEEGAQDNLLQWTSFNQGKAKGKVPGNGQTMINIGESLAWLGNQYDNTLQTGAGNDYIDGGNGNDTLKGEAGEDTLIGGAGQDTIYGGDNQDTIYGDKTDGTTPDNVNNNDTLYGEGGKDHIIGGKGSDKLYGGEGEDILIGGISDTQDDNTADSIEGGKDYDTYYAGDSDTIYDSDGKGVVSFEGAVLSGGKWNEEKGVYEGDGGEYTLDNGVLTFKKGTQTLTITNYHKDAKDLKIVLSGKKDDDDHDDDNNKDGGDGGNGGNFSSPLVLDLNNDGVTSQDIYNTNTHFDMNLDGYKERTAWIQSEDGLLALDKNQDGIINNSNELFGDNTYLPNGTKASNGFEALKQYDINNDGTIDNKDDIYDDLKVWIDKNQDGISTQDELKTLQELNISSIDINPEQIDTTQSRNNISHTATFTQDGEIKKIDDVWFEVDNQDTIYDLEREVA